MSLDKKYNRESLDERKDLMVTASFADALKRNLWINPVVVNFGKVKYGGVYEKVVKVKNEDPIPQRIGLEQPSIRNITVKQKELGTVFDSNNYIFIKNLACTRNNKRYNCYTNRQERFSRTFQRGV